MVLEIFQWAPAPLGDSQGTLEGPWRQFLYLVICGKPRIMLPRESLGIWAALAP